MGLGDLITFLGPFSFAAVVSTCLVVTFSLFITAEKRERGFLALIFFILLMLFGYTVSNSLLGFLGFNTDDQIRIERNKHTIIFFSRLEVFFLTLSIVAFSGFVSYLIRSRVAFVKFFLTALIGLIIGILSLSSDEFFYSDRLKLNINKYMGEEGELFIIFILFFVVVVVFELVFLLLSQRKVKKDVSFNPERLKSVIVGFLVVIFFGVLEVLELFGFIRLYPYVPSLLGIGIVIFGLILLRLALFDFQEKIKEIRFLDSLLGRLDDKKKKILDSLALQYSEFNQSLISLRKSLSDAFHVPSLSMQYINEIVDKVKAFPEYYLSKLKELEEVFEKSDAYEELGKEIIELDINELFAEVGKKFREFENLKKEIRSVVFYKGIVSENFSSFGNNVDRFVSVFTQVCGVVGELEELIERLRIVSINTEIISYKKSIQELSFLESISSEILDKVLDSKILLRLIVNDLEKLRSIGTSLKRGIIESFDVVVSATSDLDSYVFEFEPPEEYKLLLGDIYSNIMNMWKYTRVLRDFFSTLVDFVFVRMKDSNDKLNLVAVLASEVFSLQFHLSSTVKTLGENISLIEEVFKEMDGIYKRLS